MRADCGSAMAEQEQQQEMPRASQGDIAVAQEQSHEGVRSPHAEAASPAAGSTEAGKQHSGNGKPTAWLVAMLVFVLSVGMTSLAVAVAAPQRINVAWGTGRIDTAQQLIPSVYSRTVATRRGSGFMEATDGPLIRWGAAHGAPGSRASPEAPRPPTRQPRAPRGPEIPRRLRLLAFAGRGHRVHRQGAPGDRTVVRTGLKGALRLAAWLVPLGALLLAAACTKERDTAACTKGGGWRGASAAGSRDAPPPLPVLDRGRLPQTEAELDMLEAFDDLDRRRRGFVDCESLHSLLGDPATESEVIRATAALVPSFGALFFTDFVSLAQRPGPLADVLTERAARRQRRTDARGAPAPKHP